MMDGALATVLIAMLGGAIRVSTPFLLVALGETITEKSGRINLGLEGTLVLGAMVAYMTSYKTGSPWIGALAAGVVGTLLGALHATACSLPRVNDVAIGIAMMALGLGLAFFFGIPRPRRRKRRVPPLHRRTPDTRSGRPPTAFPSETRSPPASIRRCSR